LTDARGEDSAAPGVRLTLTCDGTDLSRTGISDERGTFRFADVPTRTCSVTTDLPGFAAVTARSTVVRGETSTLNLHLQIVPIHSGILVTGARNKRRHQCHGHDGAYTLRPCHNNNRGGSP